MTLNLEVRVGRRRAIIIPKVVAEMLDIDEGARLKLTVENDRIVLERVQDAITLSIRGEKIAKIRLEELEEESVEQQEKLIKA